MAIVGVGLDLVDSARVERIISRHEDIFRTRILGPTERAEIDKGLSRQIRVLAYTRAIAAKEAFLKALGTGLAAGMRWLDVETIERCGPKPKLAVGGETARVLAALKADSIDLSLSSIGKAARGHVTAMVILTRQDTPET